MTFERHGKLCNDDFVEGCLSPFCVDNLPACLISTTTKTLSIPLCFQRMFVTRYMPKYLTLSMTFKFVHYAARDS